MNHPPEQLSTSVSPVTRRRFLAFSGVAGAGALAVGASQIRWGDLVQAAATSPLVPEAGVLVVITLYGGNDGLNTVVPTGDPVYQQARAELAYRPEDVLDLGQGLGFNPGLTSLHGLWRDQGLAIVRGVGYPKADRSHFRSMAIWQTAAPDTPARSGWLGRWLDATTTDPLQAVSLDSVTPPLLAGEKLAAASFPLSGLALPKGGLGTAIERLARPDPGDDHWLTQAAKQYADLGAASKTLGPARQQAAGQDDDQPEDRDDESAKGGSAGGQSQLAAQLDLVATMIDMGVPTRVYSVSLGGFDTHSDERGTQERLLGELDAAVAKFRARLQGSERGRQVVTMIYSEFGRRVVANASDGTDHGTAGPVFLFGDGIHGGFLGEEPSLTDLDDGDLRAGVDFRSIYASVLDRVLGAEPEPLLAGYGTRLDGLFD
ncbi:DUF1501 domain-containing protein [Microlunatus speluncae]|uniref:DUF1501 domain-containing protein n=1 Tax=Microlunatus speluncae TaxID=2594267 RepID=UPI00126642B9|nr:DUF1501 domain-containing protein [Microlunatus speluncae]